MHWLQFYYMQNSWQHFLKAVVISRTTWPILGMFVLIWVHFSCWIQIWPWKFEFHKFSTTKKFENVDLSSVLNPRMKRVKKWDQLQHNVTKAEVVSRKRICNCQVKGILPDFIERALWKNFKIWSFSISLKLSSEKHISPKELCRNHFLMKSEPFLA